MRPEIVIFAEELRFIDTILIVLYSVYRQTIVRYDEHRTSRAARKALALLENKATRIRFVPLNLSLEKREPWGATLSYLVDAKLRKLCNVICQTLISSESRSFQNMVKCYLSSVLRNRVVFIESSKREIADGIKEHTRNIILIKHDFCNRALTVGARDKNYTIKQMFYNRTDVINLLRSFYRMFVYVRSRFRHPKARTNIDEVRPAIWVQYDDGFDSFVDTSFWRKGLGEREFDIVFYLDRSDTPCRDDITKNIEDNGYRWIDLHKPHNAVPKEDLCLSLMLQRMLGSCLKKGPFWLRLFRLQYEEQLFMQTAIYRHFSTRMLVQNLDNYWGQEVQARALEAVGGILMGFHWSNYPCVMTPLHLFPHHVFFVWGQIIRDNLEAGDHTCRYILPSGMWIGLDTRTDTGGLRTFRAEHPFVLSVFDSSTAYNIHQTPSALSEFFLRILSLLEGHSSWAAVLKSKNQDLGGLRRLPAGDDIVSRLMKLLEDGRVIIPDITMSPVTVAQYTDLSVCYGLNSAGIVVGCHGYRAVHWDCSGWRKHPFYAHTENNIIFETLESLDDAVVRASMGDMSVGDFSFWKRSFNHFPGDGAIERIGTFVNDYMQSASGGEDGSEALDRAVERFVYTNEIEESFFRSRFRWD